MSPLDTNTLLSQIDQLLATTFPVGDPAKIYGLTAQILQGAVSLAEILYPNPPGGESRQLHTLMKAAQHARSDKSQSIESAFYRQVLPVVEGTLRAMRADIETGLVGNLKRQTAGEVLTDMLGLAEEALAAGDADSRNVAAVLTAAAFEDTIRRMGASFAGVAGRPDLQDVLKELRAAGVLTGPPATTAQSFLKFRNDALHADWSQLDRAVVASCLAFVKQKIQQHFS